MGWWEPAGRDYPATGWRARIIDAFLITIGIALFVALVYGAWRGIVIWFG